MISALLLTALAGLRPADDLLQIPVGELVFQARVAGPADGQPVLLLHGFPETSYAWRHQLQALGQAGFRAVAPDQRGYSPGARPEAVEEYAMSFLVDDVIGIADALGFERFHLVGHDWGGAVAWVVATVHADRIHSLTVVSTPHYAAFASARSRSGSDQAERSSYMQRWAQPGAEAEFLADDAAGLRACFDAPFFTPQDVQEYVAALGSPPAMRAALHWYGAMASSGTGSGGGGPPPRVAPVRVPTLYVWGTEDSAFGREAAQATPAYVTGPYRFERMIGSGHWLMEQEPARVNALLLEHLRAN
jgi:pimeloyl-ACP methyl ester carboxylesterase